METGMVAATVSGFAADVEKKWLAQLSRKENIVDVMGAGRKVADRVMEATGAFGLSSQAEHDWLKILGSRA